MIYEGYLSHFDTVCIAILAIYKTPASFCIVVITFSLIMFNKLLSSLDAKKTKQTTIKPIWINYEMKIAKNRYFKSKYNGQSENQNRVDSVYSI